MVSHSKRQSRFSASRPVIFVLFLVPALSGIVSTAKADYASIVMDAESGRVLHEVNADSLNYPASLTKMMTLYMIFSALNNREITLDTRWRVSSIAASQPPTKLGLKAGQTISVRNCILALVTKSANDMAVVAAEGLAGSEFRFARMMTEKSRDLNMTQTRFRNASGLPDLYQITTARDISILALALLRDFPEYYGFFSTRVFQYGNRRYRNHNHLLHSYQGTDGIKTGYIRASGYNLAASTVRNGRRLVGVVMGGRSSKARNQQMMSLLDLAFAKLERDEPRYARISSANRPLIVSTDAKPGVMETPDQLDAMFVPRSQPGEERARQIWGIQVGAFSQFRLAESAVARARAIAPILLESSRTMISPFRLPNGFIYRARLVGIAERDARKVCAVLKSNGISCITVAPSNRPAEFTTR
ncbi:MAG: D-alanyl-D-alanine carboxypeptidase [Methylococcaceae bacterium]|nr:D-alanyl-D-alanine carboxypeptidase [Methylococcaceae bacterium]